MGQLKRIDDFNEPRIEISGLHVLLTEGEFLRMQAIEGRARGKLEQLQEHPEFENSEHYIKVLKFVLAIND